MNFSSPFRRFPLFIALAGIIALSACERDKPAVIVPAEITRDVVCVLDGMTVADYPGPKAQVFYEGKAEPDFFCDTIEMFSIYLRPEQQRQIRALYVQDMSKADWKHPQGHWIDARQAFYVVGSKEEGSMGATFASFASEADAQAFANREGGKVFHFSQITPDMAALDGGVIKDHGM